tara:strand:+ start:4991 stop:5977 length:987 start_codon:yes stop_codon:yes gene_type:complete
MKKILLIGGGGYVGAATTDFLLKEKIKLNVLDNFIYNHKNAIKKFISNKNYQLIEGDFTDLKKLDLALNDVTDVVLLAGLVGDPITKKYPSLNQKYNIDGIKNCINYLNNKKINKLVFVSTCSNYGIIPDNTLANEEYELKPLSLYAKAKVEIENFIQANSNKFNFETVTLRFATAFGFSDRMRFDLTVNEFTLELLKNKILEVYDPDTWRPYCHVQDFARIILKVLTTKGDELNNQIFNCGSNSNNFTKRNIIEMIKSKIDNVKVNFVEGDTDPRNYRVDFTKLEKKFLFKSNFNVSDGIQEIIDNKNLFLKREKKFFGNYEINEKN